MSCKNRPYKNESDLKSSLKKRKTNIQTLEDQVIKERKTKRNKNRESKRVNRERLKIKTESKTDRQFGKSVWPNEILCGRCEFESPKKTVL